MDLLEWASATWTAYDVEGVCMLCLYMQCILRTPGQHAEASVQFVRGSSDALGSKI